MDESELISVSYGLNVKCHSCAPEFAHFVLGGGDVLGGCGTSR